MTELMRKAPTLLAIVAIAYLGKGLLDHGLNSTLIGAALVAIAGLGGFYVNDALRRRTGGESSDGRPRP